MNQNFPLAVRSRVLHLLYIINFDQLSLLYLISCLWSHHNVNFQIISYQAPFDRFKLIIGQLQLDNQLPLTVMPVMLATEDMPDINHPVFKATITMCNNNADGTQVYPYIYVRVSLYINFLKSWYWCYTSLIQSPLYKFYFLVTDK